MMLKTLTIDWKMLLLEGVVFLILGLISLFHPLLMAMSIEILLGSLLVVTGLIEGFRALTHLKEQQSVPMLIAAAFALIAGILLLTYPLSGVITLTLLLTAFFFIDGIARIINSWQYRALKGSVWLFFSGLISLLLAILITIGLPTSAVWVIGIYFGIYMLFLGISLIIFSYYAKKGTLAKTSGGEEIEKKED